MNAYSRIVLFTLAGLAAGLLTWFVSDLSGLMRFPDTVGDMTPAEVRQQQIICMVFGGLVGALLGTSDGLAAGSAARIPRAAGVGLFVGTISGLLGLLLGQPFFGALYVTGSSNPVHFLGNVLARAIGWGFIGALVGTADGWRKLSVRVGRNGLIGGFLGGFIGGAVFEVVPYLLLGLPRPGIVSRFFSFVITGGAIGLFVALVQELLKEAWLRVEVGRNEGKEYLIDKAETQIGRSELSDVPLFGDPAIERTHAVLQARDGGRWVLRDDSRAGVSVNGERIDGERPVRDGDRIRIGNRTLVFRERLTRQRTVAPRRDVGAAPRPAALAGAATLSESLQAPAARATDSSGSGAAARPAAVLDGPPPGAGPHLIATSGPHAGATFALKALVVIGRDPGNDVALPSDTKASRIHARLLRDSGNFVIEDVSSTNGTFVNGQKVTRQTLAPGDTVLVGETHLRFG